MPHKAIQGKSIRLQRTDRDLKKIAELFHVRSAFLRSVNVALDYTDPSSSRDYVVTGFARELFDRLSAALRVSSSERAWRVTGDYGSGKSAFALCFARVAAGERAQLPAELQRFVPKGFRLEPVLVSGAPEPLEQSIRKGLESLRQRVFRSPPKALEITTQGHGALLELIDAHIATLRKQGLADGIILILDELGQNLHHAAQHPSVGDISLLQTLGEKADRSNAKPLVVVALLHQGLSTYSADLDLAARREWEKVAGRFKEIVFAQPIEQVATLVAEMLGVKSAELPQAVLQEAERGMQCAARGGLYGAAPAEKFLSAIAHRFYPLHPTVFPLLVRLLRRFGQNERSLVGFLSSHEPFGFREFAETHHIGDGFFRLADLYDYFKANLAATLVNGQAAHWDVIDAIVAQAQVFGEPATSVLKTIGLINLVNDPSIAATEVVVGAAVGHVETDSAVRRLRDSASIIHERGSAKGLSLWPHSSVNLDNAVDQADEALASQPISARAIAALLAPRAMVARRHYIETGNLRHFTASYLDCATFRECLATKFPETPGADGHIFVVLTNDEGELAALSVALRENRDRLGPLVLVGVSSPVTKVAETVRDLKRWQWIKNNLRELAGDAYARTHVNREIKRCHNKLEKDLYHLVQLRDGDDRVGTIIWFDHFGPVKGSPTKGILPYLSERCRKVFSECPCVANELINRRVTSSASSRARSVLIEAIATSGDRENLGFDTSKNPPEFAIYLSVLIRGCLHIKTRDGWRFRSANELSGNDPLRLAPSLAKIHELLVAADTTRCPVPQLFNALRTAPYGVRDGFLPLLLAVYLAGHWDQTAIYEDGTFIEKPGSNVFQRLTKEPEAFDLQHCSIRGVRRELFNQVASLLGFPATRHPDVLQIVRPLMLFAAQLPEYSLYTERQVTAATRRVRKELLNSREPATLFFHDLPRALSFEPFSAEHTKTKPQDATKFAEALNSAVLDLRESYPRMLKRVTEAILSSFRFNGSVSEFREQFSWRIKSVEHALTDPELKVFAVRVADPALGDREWSESIATYVGRKAPERWRDTDEDEFHHRLTAFAGRFVRAEAAGFNGKVVDPEKIGRAVRLTLTRPDGREVDRVIHWSAREDPAVERAKGQLRHLMQELGPTAMAAAAQYVWDFLQEPKE
jgi:hypothetical protein